MAVTQLVQKNVDEWNRKLASTFQETSSKAQRLSGQMVSSRTACRESRRSEISEGHISGQQGHDQPRLRYT